MQTKFHDANERICRCGRETQSRLRLLNMESGNRKRPTIRTFNPAEAILRCFRASRSCTPTCRWTVSLHVYACIHTRKNNQSQAHIDTCIPMHTHLHTHTHRRMHVHAHTCTRTYILTHTDACMYTHMHTHLHTHTPRRMHVNAHTCTRTYILTHTDACMYTHTHHLPVSVSGAFDSGCCCLRPTAGQSCLLASSWVLDVGWHVCLACCCAHSVWNLCAIPQAYH
jgi:hypothetical protein